MLYLQKTCKNHDKQMEYTDLLGVVLLFKKPLNFRFELREMGS
jgi:hypothetical protein